MNPGYRFTHFVFLVAAALLLSGCSMLKPSIAPVRHFVLAPIPANEPTAATQQLSIAIGPVRMPAYLQRTSVAIRRGTNEIEYMEDARWGERLDQCFQRTLAVNLSRLLPSDHVYSVDWAGTQVTARVFVNLQQFEVDSQGRGTLSGHWRIQNPDDSAPPRSGTVRLERAGPAPGGDAAIIAAILSDLTADFSRVLTQAIRQGTKTSE